MPYYYKNPPTSRINFYCSALNLKEFSYCSFLPQEVSVPSPCHTSAKIIVHESQSYVSYMTDFKVFELLSQFSHAKSIKFELTKILNLRQPEKLCEFPTLTHLEVGFVSVDILLTLLQKTPVLKTLVLKGICKSTKVLVSSGVVDR